MFVREQSISKDLVFYRHDREALHMVVKDRERIIGSTRVQFLADNRAELERMAILKRYRRRGIGREIFLSLDALRNKPLDKSSNYENLKSISLSPFL